MLTTGSAVQKANATQSFWNGWFTIADPFDGLVHTKDSTQETETYTWHGNAPMPSEWVGDRNYKTMPEQSQDVANKQYESSVKVDKKFIKFQQWDEVGTRVSNLGYKASVHRIKLNTALIVAGTSDTIGTAYDGQYFFDSDHVDPGASYTTSQDNETTSAAATGTQPTDVELAAAIRSHMNLFWAWKDDRGDPWDALRDDAAAWVVMVPPAYRSVANQVAINDTLGAGTDAIGNDLKGMFTPRVNQFLTAVDRFYTFYAGNDHKPIILQQAGGVELNDEIDIHSGHTYYTTDYWGRVFYGQWRTGAIHVFT